MTCDEIVTSVLLTGRLDAATGAHVAMCPRCRADVPAMLGLARSLGARHAPEPSHDRLDVLVHAATPLLAANARRARATRPLFARALAAAAAVLPLVLALDLQILRATHALVAAWLPATVATATVAGTGAAIVVLLAAAVAAIPLLAARQAHHLWEDAHA